jgi:uncharacterized protein
MNALYECEVDHCRLKPKRHAFAYRVFMFCVDIEDLPSLGQRLFGFSHNRWNLFSIDDRDHIDLGLAGGIRTNLIAWLEQQKVHFPVDSRIQLLTFPRVLGYGFNPVSFYYIQTKAGETLAVVAEVVNTFREMKLYAIESLDTEGLWYRRVAKNFYVSPFSDPGMEFDFKLGEPGQKWRVNIDTHDAEGRVLLSSIRGEQRTLSSLRLLEYALKYPLLSFQIILRIHWHALLLWLRRVPFLRKGERLDAQKDVMRPHSSFIEKRP